MAAPMELGEAATSGLYSLENVQNLTTQDDIKKAYEQLSLEEANVNDELKILLEQRGTLESKMVSLHSSLPNLQLIYNDSQNLSSMIAFTSTLAENVSSKVRQLDLAKSRVTLCMQRVGDILDLKFCTDGVQTALQDEDYEKAAGHINRFRSLDENVLRMSADASEGSTLDTSFKLLHEAQSKLKNIVHSKFDAAVLSGDVASVERFFKIFPLIGEHEGGLLKFSKYLSAQLAETADNNLKLALAMGPQDKRANVLYADTITLLFEGIARVVEIHQPLVETYYGPGRMFTMMKNLQNECDRQARKIVDHFKSSRDFDKTAHLVQHTTANLKQTEKLDPKHIDVLLGEVALLNTRAELYLRFVRRRITNDMEIGVQEQEARIENQKEIDHFVLNCQLSRLMQEMIGDYIMMEEYFMREMVVKAVAMDTIEEGSESLTSSMVDDTFFIVKKAVRRALTSSSVDGVCAMLNHACTILEQDYQEILYGKLRQGFPFGFDFTQAYNLVQTSIQKGSLQSADVETEKAKTAFLTTLNNAEVSCDYIKTLKSSIEENIEKLYSHLGEQGKTKLETCLSDLGEFSKRFKDVLEFGFAQLHSNAIKPRLKPWVSDFLHTSHDITEVDFSNYETNDPWVRNFIMNLDNLLVTFKSSLTSGNYDTLVIHIANEITTQLEKAVFKTTFNQLGGLLFDKELRALVAYLTCATTWSIRDKFARLNQMSTILNLNRVSEILEYCGPNSGSLTWRLTPTEIRQILALRVDFRSEDIKRLKL